MPLAVAGLDLPQRSQVVKALRDGPVPADPRVLAAAIRVGDLSTAYRRRVPLWQRKAAWFVPALWIVAGLLGFVGHDVRTGLTWTAVALLVAVLGSEAVELTDAVTV